MRLGDAGQHLVPGCSLRGRIAGEPGGQRRRISGQRKKVALVACMRKLLTMLNAIAKHGSMWDSTMHCA